MSQNGKPFAAMHFIDDFLRTCCSSQIRFPAAADAKDVIKQGMVKVNGEVETRRGKKLVDGDEVSFDGQLVKIEK